MYFIKIRHQFVLWISTASCDGSAYTAARMLTWALGEGELFLSGTTTLLQRKVH
jgi:hypothetical protein